MNRQLPAPGPEPQFPIPTQEQCLPSEDIVAAELVESPPPVPSLPPPRPRRKRLPLVLLGLTCASTFFAGATEWAPHSYLLEWLQNGDAMAIRRTILDHWQDGLLYMACVLGILFTHEMGHFLATLRHGIPASLPFFLPLPISPIGTMGAVIGMDGMRADRKQMFDIGIAGPLAGLVVAVPILLLGIERLDLQATAHGPFTIDSPWAVRLLLDWVRPKGYQPGAAVWFSQLNPFFMAGWVGLVVTGLNMLPVSQLDGGHVIHTLFGRSSRWIARGFILLAIGYTVFNVVWERNWTWSLMVLLVLLMGVDHPPTRDESVPLGWFRIVLGILSLSIPVLCFPPRILQLVTG